MRRFRALVLPLPLLSLALTACGPSRDEQLADCTLSHGRSPGDGELARCLQLRYGWDHPDAAVAEVRALAERQRADSARAEWETQQASRTDSLK